MSHRPIGPDAENPPAVRHSTRVELQRQSCIARYLDPQQIKLNSSKFRWLDIYPACRDLRWLSISHRSPHHKAVKNMIKKLDIGADFNYLDALFFNESRTGKKM
jgi:hypothetical protein